MLFVYVFHVQHLCETSSDVFGRMTYHKSYIYMVYNSVQYELIPCASSEKIQLKRTFRKSDIYALIRDFSPHRPCYVVEIGNETDDVDVKFNALSKTHNLFSAGNISCIHKNIYNTFLVCIFKTFTSFTSYQS